MRNRQELIDAFQQGETGAYIERFDPSPGILLGTPKTLGTGFTCTVADTVVIWEPQGSNDVEKQSWGRIRRIGQTKAVFGYRFADSNMQHEYDIVFVLSRLP
ncbi:hypothetical protein BDV19DRAFT_383552 [Aspergillus venezuelensis]